MKDAFFLGSSLADLRNFPAEARNEAGFQLRRVQSGLDPENWKPMQGIGAGVREIRIHEKGAFRVIYLATRPEGVYVLHCFQKKTQKTSQQDINMARQRYRLIGE
ncbi:MAG: type II toxin-antitoxin system RelE/ParE family toxin [Candidatus Methylumidiphilus sp.]